MGHFTPSGWPFVANRERNGVFNPFGRSRVGGAAAPVTVTWDPANKHTTINLSGSNLIATKIAPDGWAMVRGTHSQSAGKRYFEITPSAITTATLYGLTSGDHSSFDRPAANGATKVIGLDHRNANGLSEKIGFTSNALNAYSLVTNNVVGIAVDFDNKNVWWSINGSYTTVRTGADPATNTNPCATWVGSATLYPAGWMFGASTPGCVQTIAASGTFITSPPAGFSAWNA